MPCKWHGFFFTDLHLFGLAAEGGNFYNLNHWLKILSLTSHQYLKMWDHQHRLPFFGEGPVLRLPALHGAVETNRVAGSRAERARPQHEPHRWQGSHRNFTWTDESLRPSENSQVNHFHYATLHLPNVHVRRTVCCNMICVPFQPESLRPDPWMLCIACSRICFKAERSQRAGPVGQLPSR